MSVTTRNGQAQGGDLFSAKKLSRRERKALYAPVKETDRTRRPRTSTEPERAAGPLGWDIPGGGKASSIPQPVEFRGPTVQVCGMYPFNVGSSLALIGTPLGPHLEGRGMVCGDPVSYFAEGLINNPSAFVLARPGVGKSTLIRHIAGYLPAKGVLPIVLSDWRPDYRDLVERLDGQVIKLGRSAGFVNPLDPGPMTHRLSDLPEDVRARVVSSMRGRRINVMSGLCGLALGGDLVAHERSMLSKAMEVWDQDNGDRVPVVHDILRIIEGRHPALRRYAQDRGEDARYDERVQRLVDALNALDGGSETFGRVFAEPTTVDLKLDRAVVFDLSEFEEMDSALQAGVQLVCWSYGSTAVSAAKALADAGLGPRRTYLLIMDELWRALRAAAFMVDRVDEITRLNRAMGLGQMLCTHGMDDLKVHDEATTSKAWGFVARSEIVYLGGLNPGEMGNLEEVFALSNREKDMLTNWAQAGEVNPVTGAVGIPRGRGRFLFKVGKKPGIPFMVDLLPVEAGVHDTSKAWEDQIAAMRAASSQPVESPDPTY